MAILRINAIKCFTQEDFWGDDSTYIVVNGSTVWGPQDMDDDQTRTVNVEVSFLRSVDITVMEVDDDPHDNLGTNTLRATQEGEHHLKYTDDGADYSVWVTIVDTRNSSLPPMRNRTDTVELANAKVFTQTAGNLAAIGEL